MNLPTVPLIDFLRNYEAGHYGKIVDSTEDAILFDSGKVALLGGYADVTAGYSEYTPPEIDAYAGIVVCKDISQAKEAFSYLTDNYGTYISLDFKAGQQKARDGMPRDV